MEINNFEFICCYCNEGIESSKVNPADVNILIANDVNILINIDKSKEYQYSQTLYTHIECFSKRLHPAIKMHFHLDTILDDIDEEQ